jgi:hypothetical protein
MISRTATRWKISPVRQGRSNPDRPSTSAIDHAVRVVHGVCCLAGAASLIDNIRTELRAEGINPAPRHRDLVRLADFGSELSGHLGPSRLRLHGAPRSGPMGRHRRQGCRLYHLPKTRKPLAFSRLPVRSAGHVQSLIRSTHVPCRSISCATVGSTKWPTRYSCLFATSPTATWSAGSTGNCKLPMIQPAPIGSPGCGKL